MFAFHGVHMKINRPIILSLLLVSALVNAAELAPRTKEYSRCIEKAGAVDPLVLECISDEYARQDKRLNAAYRKLMSSLKGERKKQLLEAQRLWTKYTDENSTLPRATAVEAMNHWLATGERFSNVCWIEE
jgi:uncharacterized protein YecT (DUF1311 family)